MHDGTKSLDELQIERNIFANAERIYDAVFGEASGAKAPVGSSIAEAKLFTAYLGLLPKIPALKETQSPLYGSERIPGDHVTHRQEQPQSDLTVLDYDAEAWLNSRAEPDSGAASNIEIESADPIHRIEKL